MNKNKLSGKVYLVGAGPGDPGLITVKGLECISVADVIIYDYLASPFLLKHASNNAEVIYVGKKGGDHTLSQEKINTLIVEKAKEGATVTRLKGGDPFIFGRGGEEVQVLAENKIEFEIVPGVTSAIAAPAYAGIPLTHRKFTSTLAFITGHEDPDKAESNIDWASISKVTGSKDTGSTDTGSKGIGTLVFLMGIKNLPNITQKLIENGRSPKTPVALVRWGTTNRQVTVTGTLDTIVHQADKIGMKPPAIIIVGEVVSLRQTMKWFEKRPLMGKKIVVTRAREQASDLTRLLSDLGAEFLECPTIEIQPPDDLKPIDMAIKNLSSYDWLIFTSVNGVKFFFERLFAKGMDVRALHNLQTATIGPATAKKLLDFGLNSDIVPESYRAESVVEAFGKIIISGKKILLPRAKEARPILPVELGKMGAVVDEVTAYCTKKVSDSANLILKKLQEKKIDLITFTSSSTVKNFRELLPSENLKTLMSGVTIASIGPITAETAKKSGFDVHIVAKSFTIKGLCEAICEHYDNVSSPN